MRLDRIRDQHVPRASLRYDSGSNIHGIAEHVSILVNDVSCVNANSDLELPVLRRGSIVFLHRTLNLQSATDRVEAALKLHEKRIADGLNFLPPKVTEDGTEHS
ncbi:MAG: hypothetical protein WAN87_07555, partial [Thermoplasmata archaeon]